MEEMYAFSAVSQVKLIRMGKNKTKNISLAVSHPSLMAACIFFAASAPLLCGRVPPHPCSGVLVHAHAHSLTSSRPILHPPSLLSGVPSFCLWP